MKTVMKKVAIIGLLALASSSIQSQIIWDGTPKTFTKDNFADWTLPENQDRITEDVWITRADRRPIFNAKDQNLELTSPSGTKWAFGEIADGVENLKFDYWIATIDEAPPAMVDKDMVLYLLEEDIYIDIKFTSWTSGEDEGGGGFSYDRATGTLSQKEWTTNPISFTKANNADWTDEANQDRITENVWLARADSRGLFNIAKEDEYKRSPTDGIKIIASPEGTEWAFGSIADDVSTLKFDVWAITVDESPPSMVGRDMVMHLVEEDIYIDIKFTSWTSGEDEGGGGFSYERSTGSLSERLWTGPKTTFTKANNADWTIAENQDRITEDVWITRASNKGIFNIAQESSYYFDLDLPSNTQWAIGKTSDGIENLRFASFITKADECPPCLVDTNMVLKIVSDDIYIDLTFTSWTSGEDEGGGGFSYIRSTEQSASVRNSTPSRNALIYPNPTDNQVRFQHLNTENALYQMYNTKGQIVLESKVSNGSTISLEQLEPSLYFYQITQGDVVSYGRLFVH